MERAISVHIPVNLHAEGCVGKSTESVIEGRPKVLLLAYLISPRRGSEYSVAWNFVVQMSRYCDITVLYGSAGEHMGDMDDMDSFLSAQSLPNVEFVPIYPSGLAKILNAANRRGYLVYTFYLAYRLWHLSAYRVAIALLKARAFDVVHYLGPIGYREPGYLWKLPLPYVWGPIGGATNVPTGLVAALPFSGKLKLLFRATVNACQLRLSGRVRQAFRRADVVLTATTENQRIFERVFGRLGAYLPENGIVGPVALDLKKFAKIEPIRLVWIGTIEARKALILLISALSRCRHARRFAVDVIGDGPLKHSLTLHVKTAGLEDVFRWHGQIPRADVRQVLNKGHLHVVTSVSEGNPTTIWEAMSCGVPTLTLDHCGMHDTVLPDCGFKIGIADFDTVVSEIALTLDEISEQPQLLKKMAEKVVVHASKFHWDNRPNFFLSCYRQAAVEYHKK